MHVPSKQTLWSLPKPQRKYACNLQLAQHVGNMHPKLFGLFILSTAANFATADEWIRFHKGVSCGGGREGKSDFSSKNHGCFSNPGQSVSLHGGQSYCTVTLGVYSDGGCNNKVSERHIRVTQHGRSTCADTSSLNNHNFKVIQNTC